MMKKLAILSLMLIGMTSVIADQEAPPVVNHNVHVLQNAQPFQCTSSMRMDIDPAEVSNYTAGGEVDVSSPGVRSCSGCMIDRQTDDCVCDTCYDHYLAY